MRLYFQPADDSPPVQRGIMKPELIQEVMLLRGKVPFREEFAGEIIVSAKWWDFARQALARMGLRLRRKSGLILMVLVLGAGVFLHFHRLYSLKSRTVSDARARDGIELANSPLDW
jgi:hypothetical protein